VGEVVTVRPVTAPIHSGEARLNGPSSQRAASAPVDSADPKVVAEAQSEIEPARTKATAHDIRLEVNGGDHRIEVRLSERGGEVRVAVRTPDDHLAGALREDLPALSSRLSESGFRSETWHPAAPNIAEWHPQAEPAAGGAPQEANYPPGQNGREQHQSDHQSERPKLPKDELNQKEKGKDFEWYMSTLR
jgi:hypothetical protein